MWKVNGIFTWFEMETKSFENLEDAQWAFRGVVTKAFARNPKYLSYFMAMIDKYFGKNPLPEAVEQFKICLRRYITEPTYPEDPQNFTLAPYEDKNIKIFYNPESQTVQLQIKNDDLVGTIPSVVLPVGLSSLQDLTAAFFVLSNNPMIIVPTPGGETAFVRLEQEEDDEEEDYDDEEDDDEEEDDEEDYDEEDDEEEVPYTPCRPSTPISPSQPPKKGLHFWERIELRQARGRYERAVNQYAMHKHSSSAYHYETLEKIAFARLMSLETKYAGRS